MSKNLKIVAAVAFVGLAVAAGLNAAPAEKVTICHAAGQDDTTHFVEITASWNAIYGQAGHFYEDGTPRAGHEQDSEGPCEKKDPEPDPK